MQWLVFYSAHKCMLCVWVCVSGVSGCACIKVYTRRSLGSVLLHRGAKKYAKSISVYEYDDVACSANCMVLVHVAGFGVYVSPMHPICERTSRVYYLQAFIFLARVEASGCFRAALLTYSDLFPRGAKTHASNSQHIRAYVILTACYVSVGCMCCLCVCAVGLAMFIDTVS